MSKFLFVSSYDLRRNTSGNIRTVALMNCLHDNGHVVHCIFVPSDHSSDKNIYENLVKVDKLFAYPQKEIICINQSLGEKKMNEDSFKESIRSWAIQMYMKFSVYDVYEIPLLNLRKNDLNDLDETYDYIVSSAEPRSSHSFAKKIIKLKKYRAKWILYWGDPMTNDVASTKLFKKREENEERRLITGADISVYTNPCAVSYMKKKYPDLAFKIDWIPTTDFKKIQEEKSKGDLNKIGYFGDYRQIYRNIYPFYQACCENNYNTIIIGGADKELESTKTITVYGRKSRNEINKFEKDCGILMVLENISKSGNCIQVPGKLYHYGLTYKYILVITESHNIAKEYEKYNRFIFVPNNKDIIAEAIKNIQAGKYSRMNLLPVKEFEYDNIAKQFFNVINGR